MNSDSGSANQGEHHSTVPRQARSWRRKFADAFRGVAIAVPGQNSFFVHFAFAVAVVICAFAFPLPAAERAALFLCITVVLTAEMFNTALERLSRAITDEHNEEIRDALDIGSGAVLTAAIGAAIVGTWIFAKAVLNLLGVL